jgi:hypothetical protein
MAVTVRRWWERDYKRLCKLYCAARGRNVSGVGQRNVVDASEGQAVAME